MTNIRLQVTASSHLSRSLEGERMLGAGDDDDVP
jgi:hypothetical protein